MRRRLDVLTVPTPTPGRALTLAAAVLLAVLFAGGLASCGGDDDSATEVGEAAATGEPTTTAATETSETTASGDTASGDTASGDTEPAAESSTTAETATSERDPSVGDLLDFCEVLDNISLVRSTLDPDLTQAAPGQLLLMQALLGGVSLSAPDDAPPEVVTYFDGLDAAAQSAVDGASAAEVQAQIDALAPSSVVAADYIDGACPEVDTAPFRAS